MFPPFREVDENEDQVIKSEKQSSNVHETRAEGGSSRLPFDPEKYRKYLAETGWSEKVQDEWLETLWNMMGTFVDLAWGTDSVQAVLKTERALLARKLTA